jgi:hypothetical protein
LISLEVGGAPRSKENVWPEPHSESSSEAASLGGWRRARARDSGLRGRALLELLGESEAFVSRDHQRPGHLVARDREVTVRICSHLLVLLKGELDVREATLIAALAEERDGKLEIELTRFLGDPLVRFAEDVLRLQLRPPGSVG